MTRAGAAPTASPTALGRTAPVSCSRASSRRSRPSSRWVVTTEELLEVDLVKPMLRHESSRPAASDSFRMLWFGGGYGEVRARRAAAYRAFWEHMPLARHRKPGGPDLQLYRRFTWARWRRSTCSTGASTAPTRSRRPLNGANAFPPRFSGAEADNWEGYVAE